MRVSRVETFKFWVGWCNWLFIRVSTDDDLVGWGEASLHGPIESVEIAVGELAEHLIGQDPAGPERHWHRLYNAWRWRGGATLMSALGGLDIALWDIEGKRLGVPVHRLLGGAHRLRLRCYASHWLSGVRTPDAAFAGARDAIARGFTAFKFSPITHEGLRANEAGELHRAADIVAAAREGAGADAELFIECSELLSPRLVVRLDEMLAPYRPGWFEEPIPFENAAAMSRLQAHIRTPIACGERLLSRFEFRELLERGGCNIVQPDLMHAGGFTEVRRITALADMHYVGYAPHNPGGPICTMASMHMAAAAPNFLILEQMEPQRAVRDRTSTEAVKFEDGHLVLPEAPGLGIEPDLEALAEFSFQKQPRQERPGSLYR